jgi:hypothetical protein
LRELRCFSLSNAGVFRPIDNTRFFYISIDPIMPTATKEQENQATTATSAEGATQAEKFARNERLGRYV